MDIIVFKAICKKLSKIEISWHFTFVYSKDWYKGTLTDEQLDALENPPKKPKGTGSNRRKGPKRPAHTAEE